MKKSTEAAWKGAFEKGSKAMQARLHQIHKNNPDFQDFVKKHGFGATLSVKQSQNQKKNYSSVASVKPVTPARPETNKNSNREAMIKAAADKIKMRRQAASNRAAFGGELGGGFVMPNSGFRRYSEDLDRKVFDKLEAMKESEANRNRIMGNDSAILPGVHSLIAKKSVSIGTKVKKLAKMLNRRQIRKIVEEIQGKTSLGEAQNAQATEHSGAKKGMGAYIGRKVDAKKESNKKRRENDKKSVTENEMETSKETINELKKATLASYVKAAARRVRSSTSLEKDFHADANNNISKRWDAEMAGDKVGAAAAKKEQDANDEISASFKKSAQNRITGITRATNKLAKEETVNEKLKDIKSTETKEQMQARFAKQEAQMKINYPKNVERIKDAHKKLLGKGYAYLHSGYDSQDNLEHHYLSGDKSHKKIMSYDSYGPHRDPKIKIDHRVEKFHKDAMFKEECGFDQFLVNEARESLDEYKNTFSHPGLWKTHMLKHESGKELKKGDEVTDFRGDKSKITGFELPHHEGSSGRIHVNDGSYFPGVYGAKIVKRKGVKENSSFADVIKSLYGAKRTAKVLTELAQNDSQEIADIVDVVEEVPVVDVLADYKTIRENMARKAMKGK